MAPTIPTWILSAARSVGEALGAERVVMFGSRAEGGASRRSDLDLFVIARTPLPPLQRLEVALAALPPMPCPVDVVVYTPQEVQDVPSKFVARALHTGVVVYEPDQTSRGGAPLARHCAR